MAQLLTPGVIGPVDAGGGAKLYVYEAGTSTLVSLWQDAAKALSASNPVTDSDAFGTFPPTFVDDGIYRIVITTSSGDPASPAYEWDNYVVGSSSSGSSGVNVDLVGGILYILWTGQSNSAQSRTDAATPSIPTNCKIWDDSAAEFVQLAKGAGDLPSTNGKHSLFELCTQLSPYYEEVRVVTSFQGGRPVSDWAGQPKTKGTGSIALGTTGKTLESLLTDSALFNANDILTLQDGSGTVLRDDTPADITLTVSGSTTILDLLDFLNKSEKLERRIDGLGLNAGFDAYAQEIVLQSGTLHTGTVASNEGHTLVSDQAGSGTFASVSVTPTAADRTETSANRPRYADIIAKSEAAGVPNYGMMFVCQGEADAETPIYPFLLEGSFVYEWQQVVNDLQDDGLLNDLSRKGFIELYAGRHRSQQWAQNVSISLMPSYIPNTFTVSCAGLECEDEGTVDASSYPYRIHWLPDDCEEIGRRCAAKALASVGLGGTDDTNDHNAINETSTTRGIPGSLGGPAIVVSNAHVFINREEMAGSTIRPGGTVSITILDGAFHPSKDDDGGRTLKINSESSTQNTSIYSVGHQFRNQAKGPGGVDVEHIVCKGAGSGQIEMVNNKYLQAAWDFKEYYNSTAFSYTVEPPLLRWHGRKTVSSSVGSTATVSFVGSPPSVDTGAGFEVVADCGQAYNPTSSSFDLVRTVAGQAAASTTSIKFIGVAELAT